MGGMRYLVLLAVSGCATGGGGIRLPSHCAQLQGEVARWAVSVDGVYEMLASPAIPSAEVRAARITREGADRRRVMGFALDTGVLWSCPPCPWFNNAVYSADIVDKAWTETSPGPGALAFIAAEWGEHGRAVRAAAGCWPPDRLYWW